MISQHEMEKRNLESSLLFMQQEHSNTLKALHDEISKLQKRCTELTFELTMQDDSDSNEKEEKIKELTALLKENAIQHKNLEKELAEKDEIIKDLKHQLKRNEKKFIDELKKSNQQVLALKVELDNKGGTIAYLTTEMHKFKVLQKSNDGPIISSSQSPPSGDNVVKPRRQRRLPSATDIASRPVTAKGHMPRPDAEVFLARTVPVEPESKPVSAKPTPPVLPPIAGVDDSTKKAFNRRQQLLRRRLDVKTQPEYTSLAVDKLNPSSSNTWVHEPNSTTK